MAPKKKSGSESPKAKPAEAPAPETTTKSKKEKKSESAESTAADVELGEKPEKPNKDAYEKRIEVVNKDIETKKEEIKKVIDSIDAKSTGKETYDSKRSDLFEQQKTLKEKRSALIAQKQELIAESKEEKQQQRAKRDELRDAEKIGKNLNEEAIEAQIAKHEYNLNVRTKALTLKEEKSIMMEIKKLKAQRPLAAKHTRELEALKAATNADGAVGGAGKVLGANREENIESLNKQLDALKADGTKIGSELDKLKEEQSKKMGNLKPLIEKRTTLREAVTALQDQRRAIIEERKEAFAKYKAYEDKKWELNRKKEQDAYHTWVADQEKKKAEKELEQPNIYSDDIMLLEQTIEYCKENLPKTNKLQDETINVAELQEKVEGTQMMRTKKDRETDMFFEATKLKRGKKGHKLPPKEADGDTQDSSALRKALKHTSETFAVFEKLKITRAPMVVGDLVALQKELELRLTALKEKATVWEEERKAKVANAGTIAAEKIENEEA